MNDIPENVQAQPDDNPNAGCDWCGVGDRIPTCRVCIECMADLVGDKMTLAILKGVIADIRGVA